MPTEINFVGSGLTECTYIHTYSCVRVGAFSCIKWISKRERVSWQHSMKIDEQWECGTLCAIKGKVRTGGEKG